MACSGDEAQVLLRDGEDDVMADIDEDVSVRITYGWHDRGLDITPLNVSYSMSWNKGHIQG